MLRHQVKNCFMSDYENFSIPIRTHRGRFLFKVKERIAVRVVPNELDIPLISYKIKFFFENIK